MDISLINSKSLVRLLALTERKEELLQLINQIDAAILGTLKGGVSVEVVGYQSAPGLTKQKPASKPKNKASKKAASSKGGGLKAGILSLLASAGPGGLKVRDIAAKLNTKPANISVWFSTTGKQITKKVAPGRYAAKGSTTENAASPAVTTPTPAAKPAARKRSKLSAAGRAKIAAAQKARWAARRAAKPSAPSSSPAKKGFKLPKKPKTSKA